MFWIAVIRVQDYSKTVLHVRLCREEIFHGILGSFTEIIEFLFVLWHILGRMNRIVYISSNGTYVHIKC